MARLRILCGCLAVAMMACSGPLPAPRIAAVAQVPAGSGRPEPVRLWQDASIFTLVGGLIASARHRVLVEMYELDRPDLVVSLGARRAVSGDVRVTTDPTVVESRSSADWLDRLGVPQRVYPVDDGRHQIDHVKLLIADGEAVVGGMNWGTHSDSNPDYVLETAVGAEVGRLVAVFNQDWGLAGAALGGSGEIAQSWPGEGIRAMLENALAHAERRALAEVCTLTDS